MKRIVRQKKKTETTKPRIPVLCPLRHMAKKLKYWRKNRENIKSWLWKKRTSNLMRNWFSRMMSIIILFVQTWPNVAPHCNKVSLSNNASLSFPFKCSCHSSLSITIINNSWSRELPLLPSDLFAPSCSISWSMPKSNNLWVFFVIWSM